MMMGAHQSTTAKRLADVEARAWALALRVGVLGYAEISAELSISMEAATRIMRGWIDSGKMRVQRGGCKSGRKLFELTPEYREPKDRAYLIEKQLWQTAFGLKKFTALDLLAHCREDLRPDLAEASAYCQALLRGGYLSVLVTAIPNQRDATYRMVRYTGPRPPREKRVMAIWDANEGCYAFVSGVGRVERAP